MTLKPLYDRVLVRPVKPHEVTSGGIIIPDSAKEKLKERVEKLKADLKEAEKDIEKKEEKLEKNLFFNSTI